MQKKITNFVLSGNAKKALRNYRNFGGDCGTFWNVGLGQVLLHAGRDPVGLQIRQRPQVQRIS